MASDLTLHYMPTTTTIDPVNFSLSFADDPYHPQLGLAAYTTGLGSFTPNYATLKSSVNSVSFASWATWSKVFPIDKSMTYFTTANYSRLALTTFSQTCPLSPQGGDCSDLRESHFGVLQCYANQVGTSSSAADPKGELYMEASFEFFDFVPVAGAAATPFSAEEWALYSYRVTEEKRQAGDGFLRYLYDGLHPDTEKFFMVCETGEEKESSGTVLSHISLPPALRITLRPFRSSRKFLVADNRSDIGIKVKSGGRVSRALERHTASTAMKHLYLHRGRIPARGKSMLGTLMKLHKSKPSGWKATAKKVAKTLVSEIPVVGSILGELTDKFGDSVIDWFSNLF